MNVQNELKAYLDGELTTAEQQHVEMQLAASAELREELEVMRGLKAQFNDLNATPEPSNKAAVMAQFSKVPKRSWGLPRWSYAVAAIAGIMLLGNFLPARLRGIAPATEVAKVASPSSSSPAEIGIDSEEPSFSRADASAKLEAQMPENGVSGAPMEDVPTMGLLNDRQVIFNGSLGLRVDKVSPAVDRIGLIIKGFGGYFESTNLDSHANQVSQATLIARVPSKRFEEAMTQVASVGTAVLSRSSSGEDVTSALVDIEARLKNLKAQQEQYREILKRASRIGDVLTVRDRLNSVQSEIESMTAQAASLKKLSAMSTLTISLQSEDPLAKVEPTDWSTKTWTNAVGALTAAGQLLGQGLIYLFVLAPIWLPVVLVAWWLNRRK